MFDTHLKSTGTDYTARATLLIAAFVIILFNVDVRSAHQCGACHWDRSQRSLHRACLVEHPAVFEGSDSNA